MRVPGKMGRRQGEPGRRDKKRGKVRPAKRAAGGLGAGQIDRRRYRAARVGEFQAGPPATWAVRLDLGNGKWLPLPIPHADMPFHPDNCPIIGAQSDRGCASRLRPQLVSRGGGTLRMDAAADEIDPDQPLAPVVPDCAFADDVASGKNQFRLHPAPDAPPPDPPLKRIR